MDVDVDDRDEAWLTPEQCDELEGRRALAGREIRGGDERVGPG
jgi:hypothetical protein